MATYYDRYLKLRGNGVVGIMPQIIIEKNNSDLYITYNKNKMRFDMLSYKYYGDPNYGWLILTANPQYGSMEFEIKDGVSLRIPYPLTSAIERFENSFNANI